MKDSEWDLAVPSGFKALYVAIGDYQNMVCGYLNDGKLKLTKEFLNEDVYILKDRDLNMDFPEKKEKDWER